MADENQGKDMNINELRAKLVELGVSEKATKGIISREAALTIIAAYAKQAGKKPPEGEEPTGKIDPDATANLSPKEKKETEQSWLSKRERMREALAKQPKRTILIPCEGKEKPGVIRMVMVGGREEWEQVSGAVKEVTLNGFKVLVPKGRYWEVPQQVAEVIAEGQQMTLEAGKDFDIDRVDPKTGRKISDAL